MSVASGSGIQSCSQPSAKSELSSLWPEPSRLPIEQLANHYNSVAGIVTPSRTFQQSTFLQVVISSPQDTVTISTQLDAIVIPTALETPAEFRFFILSIISRQTPIKPAVGLSRCHPSLQAFCGQTTTAEMIDTLWDRHQPDIWRPIYTFDNLLTMDREGAARVAKNRRTRLSADWALLGATRRLLAPIAKADRSGRVLDDSTRLAEFRDFAIAWVDCYKDWQETVAGILVE